MCSRCGSAVRSGRKQRGRNEKRVRSGRGEKKKKKMRYERVALLAVFHALGGVAETTENALDRRSLGVEVFGVRFFPPTKGKTTLQRRYERTAYDGSLGRGQTGAGERYRVVFKSKKRGKLETCLFFEGEMVLGWLLPRG